MVVLNVPVSILFNNFASLHLRLTVILTNFLSLYLACTIVAGIFGQVAEIHKGNVINVTLKICDHLLWHPAENVCRGAIQTLEPLLQLL